MEFFIGNMDENLVYVSEVNKYFILVMMKDNVRVGFVYLCVVILVRVKILLLIIVLILSEVSF